MVVVRGPEARVALAESLLERVVQHRGARVQEGRHCRPAPAHLLGLGHAPGDDLIHRAFHERGRDRLAASAPGGVVYQKRTAACHQANTTVASGKTWRCSREMLSYLLTVNLISQQIAAALAGVGASAGFWVFMLIAMAMLVVMGSVLEGAPALIVFGPLLFPAAQKLGIAPLHFGIVLIIAMGIGLFAPPLGVGLYTACAVGRVSMESVTRPIVKYLAVLAVALLLIAFVPAITLALPRWFGMS